MRPYSTTTVAGRLTCHRTDAENGPGVTPLTATDSGTAPVAALTDPDEPTTTAATRSASPLPTSGAMVTGYG
ncbi:MAG: hypothetical protein A2Y55_08810 [Actinobacteria bacterium RBG_16_68_12]|nr:MAG: hypothetical protein A2Y55_08810 [Actinobacteria bacterium RBG_16_68_12]